LTDYDGCRVSAITLLSFSFQGHGTPVRGITPQEVGGLRAVMQLTAKIAQYVSCVTLACAAAVFYL